MLFTSKNTLPINKDNLRSIFLAGSMDHRQEHSWRDEIIGEFGSHHIFDPTHAQHDDLSNAELKHHIMWELEAMQQSDFILLNFLKDSKSPISLVELGLYAQSGKLIVVCPQEFYKHNYVHILCEKYSTPIFNTLKEAKTLLKNSF